MLSKKLLSASLAASALFAGFTATSAMAQVPYGPRGNTATPNIDQSQAAISARIQQGLQSGRITPAEAQVLYRRDRDIDAREARMKSDGNVSPQERQQLRADLAGLSAEVERMIANNVVVGQRGTPNIDSQQYNLGQRIDEAFRAHRLSPQEAAMLHSRERNIAQREAYFKSDGVVTPQERRQLRDELAALDNEINRLAYNGRG